MAIALTKVNFDALSHKKNRNFRFGFLVGDEGFEPPTPSV